MSNSAINTIWHFIPNEHNEDNESIKYDMCENISFAILENPKKYVELFPNESELIMDTQNEIIVVKINETLVYANLKKNKNNFESEETIVNEDVILFGKPIYSFKIFIKIKNNKISPISSIYILRNKGDSKRLVFTMDTLYSHGTLTKV